MEIAKGNVMLIKYKAVSELQPNGTRWEFLYGRTAAYVVCNCKSLIYTIVHCIGSTYHSYPPEF